MSHHRAQLAVRNDFDSAYKLNRLFENPAVKSVIIKCDCCVMASRRKVMTRQQFKRIVK